MISWQSLARATVVRFFSVMAAMVAMGVSGGAGFAQDWPKAEPKAVGLDAGKLAAFDADLAGGSYGLVDSIMVIRCGKQAYAKNYEHDYGKIYGDRAKTAGPLNHNVSGEYNYFSTEFHPYYRHRDVHTMQSVSKTVTSVTFGAAMLRGDFPKDLQTPILKYLSDYKIANLDDRKRRIKLIDLLTMTAGLEWHEDLAYDDPKNSADVMEATHDWVQYVIDQPMVEEPGKKFVYSSGVTQLLSHIFKQATHKTVEAAGDALLLEAHTHRIARHRGRVVFVDFESRQDRRVISAWRFVERAADCFRRVGKGIGETACAGGGGRLQVRLPMVACSARTIAGATGVGRARIWRARPDRCARVRTDRGANGLEHFAVDRRQAERRA
jgi:hypothetical protein